MLILEVQQGGVIQLKWWVTIVSEMQENGMSIEEVTGMRIMAETVCVWHFIQTG